jgi:hypothetical protein
MRRKELAGLKDGRFNLGDGQGEGAFGLSPALAAVMFALVGLG